MGGSELGQNKLNFLQVQVGCLFASQVISMLPFSFPLAAVPASNTQSLGSLQHFWSMAVFTLPVLQNSWTIFAQSPENKNNDKKEESPLGMENVQLKQHKFQKVWSR